MMFRETERERGNLGGIKALHEFLPKEEERQQVLRAGEWGEEFHIWGSAW